MPCRNIIPNLEASNIPSSEIRTQLGLRVYHLNVRSIRNKLDELNLLLHTLNFPEVFCVSETWCSAEEIRSIKLYNYMLCDSFCRCSMKGGGVAIFVRQDIHVMPKKCNVVINETMFEYAIIHLVFKDIKILIGCFYRPPSNNITDFVNNIDRLLNNIYKPGIPTFLCGDFNINFDDQCPNHENANYLCNILKTYGLNKCIYDYTRVSKESKTIIDNIFTNIDKNLLSPKVICTDVSDHYIQAIHFQYNNISNDDICMYKYFRSFKNESNLQYFKYLLSREDWSFLATDEGSELKFNNFFNNFTLKLDSAFPLELRRIKKSAKKCPWITEQLINEGAFLRDVFKLHKNTANDEVHVIYKTLKKNHNIHIKHAKRAYYDSIMLNSNNKSKTAWNIIKSNDHSLVNKMPLSLTDTEGNVITDLNCAAESFNEFFINSVKSLTNDMIVKNSSKYIQFNPNSLFLTPVTSDEVRDIIRSITSKDSCGFDGITGLLLVNVIDYICVPISILINASFCEGTFPSILKKSIVIPIHKKCDKSQISNYRGVVLLSIFSKLFEKAYYIRLSNFLHAENLLTNNQFGFRKGMSTQDAVLSLCNFVLNKLDLKHKTATIFFDLTRAFDTVNHELLADKLSKYGIRGAPLNWIRSYLNDRSQEVHLKHDGKVFKSSACITHTGVPQGSVLGPLLFIIFINDIVNVNMVNNTFMTLFADDTTASVSANNFKDISTQLKTVISSIENYCVENGLALNSLKTNLLLCTPKNLNESVLVRINGQSIKQNDSVKFLGLHIDAHFSWGYHIDFLISKLNITCFSIWQLRNHVSLNILKMYYFGYVHSRLNYCIICWGNSGRVGELFILQKKIVRTMTFKDARYSCRNLFSELGILTIACLYILNCVCYLNNNRDKFVTNRTEINNYSLRPTYNIDIPHHKLSLVANGPLIMPIKLYNKLPLSLKTLTSNKVFKNRVTIMLLKYSFYSVSEYFNCANIEE